jgi:hypothetical protein
MGQAYLHLFLATFTWASLFGKFIYIKFIILLINFTLRASLKIGRWNQTHLAA